MRLMLAVFALALAVAGCASLPAKAEPVESVYDPAFAAEVGADQRGMRTYFMVILKTGPTSNLSEADRAKAFEGHFANINRLAEAGKLVVAGPMGQNERTYRGIFVLAVSSAEEANALVATDPAVIAGIFTHETYRWYASAALMKTPALHKRLTPPAAP